MSPARHHRDRFAKAEHRPTPIVTGEKGGRPAAPAPLTPMTPAREHRIVQALASQPVGAPAAERPADTVDPVAAQVMLRLQHDLRRLKEIQSIELKIAAKREMLPEYRSWCDAVLAAGRSAGDEMAGEVLPTIMVWCIDTGDWPRALELAAHVLRHDVPLPGRYQRAAATLIVEEIAVAALKAQAAGAVFPLDVLEAVEELTLDADMHDEVRAKLMKAIGTELGRGAEAAGGDAARPLIADAIARLQRAQQLHDRVGVKDKVRKLEKLLAANLAASPPPPPTNNDTNTAGTTG